METTISITNNWQLNIPVSVRNSLGITKPGTATIRVQGDSFIVTPTQSKIFQFAGKYRKAHKGSGLSIENLRDTVDYSKL